MLDLWKYVEQAGWIGYILVGVSILATGVIFERYFVYWLRQSRGLTKKHNAKLAVALSRKDKKQVEKIAADMTGVESEALSIVAKNINCADDTALDLAVSHVVESTNQHLWILELCGGIAPMFGILGTVAGIIMSFDGMSGAMPDTGVMVSGISVSMTTTVIGLVVSILCLVPYNHLVRRAHKRQVLVASQLQQYWINR